MNAEQSLAMVRELSENATLRPAPKKLQLGAGRSEMARPRVIIPWEERVGLPRFGLSTPLRASGRSDYRPGSRHGGGRPRRELETSNIEGEAA